MFDRVNLNNRQSMKQSGCDDIIVNDGHGIRPTLLAKSILFHSDIHIGHFRNEITMTALNDTESNSDYALRLIV